MNTETDDLIQEYVARGGDFHDWRPSYSVAPTDPAVIVREHVDAGSGETVRELALARWDVPSPPKAPQRPIINARMEKLSDRFWSGSFSNNRCIVPMLGYYEWTGAAGSKQPHFIHGDGLLSAAGVYMNEKLPEGGWRRSFAVVTREARDASGEVHDRMPAFLGPELVDEWLRPESLTQKGDADASRGRREQLIAALGETSTAVAATLSSHPVHRRLSSVRTLDPYDASIIEPVDGPEAKADPVSDGAAQPGLF